jgi:hypothetical protein
LGKKSKIKCIKSKKYSQRVREKENFGELWDTGINIIFGGAGVMALDRYVDPA